MKKRFSVCLLGILALYCLVLVACSKFNDNTKHQENTASVNEQDLVRLQKWFYESWQVKAAARVTSWEHDTSFLLNNYANLIPDWRFTKVSYQGSTKFTEVPATLPDSLEFKIGATDSLALFADLSNADYISRLQSKILWVVKETPGEDPQAEIVTFVGNHEYTKENQLRFQTAISYLDLVGYTGLVAYHDRYGQLLRVFEYRRGEVVNTVRCGVEGGLDPAPDNRVHLDVCYEILTWERDCVTVYDEYGVGQKECSDWVYVGSNMVGNCFSNGGSGGSGYYNPHSENGLSCTSFDFRKTAGNWQEAGVRGIRLKVRWLGGVKSGQIINVTLGAPVVFGLPINRENGEHYNPGEAAEIAAAAHARAEWMTVQLLKNEPFRPTDVKIEETYRNWVHLFMMNNAGTAGRTGSSSPLIVYKNAQYTFLGNGDCD